MRSLLRSTRALVLALVGSAVLWFYGMALAGAISVTSGVYVLVGTGWALIACGLFLFMSAWFLMLGISRG